MPEDLVRGDRSSVEIETIEGPPAELVEEKREGVRSTLATILLGCFVLTVGTTLVAALIYPDRIESLKEVLLILLPAETGLLGSALGFYFASEAKNK